MINVKDVPIIITLLLTLSYLIIGDVEINYLGGLHLFVDHLMIFMFLRTYKIRKYKILGMAVNSTLLVFTSLWYLFGIEIDLLFNILLFIIFLTFILMYTKWL